MASKQKKNGAAPDRPTPEELEQLLTVVHQAASGALQRRCDALRLLSQCHDMLQRCAAALIHTPRGGTTHA